MLEQDLRYAVRTLGKRPGFSAIVMLTLALGIGATTAIFSVVNGVLLRQLPFSEPDRLVMLWGVATDGDSSKVGRWSSYPDFVDIRDQSSVFQELAASRPTPRTLTGRGTEPTRLDGAAVSANLFRTLGVAPAVGRGILPEEDRPGGERVVVLGHALWQARFGSDPRVVGRTVTLDGDVYTVVGVMPPGFRYPSGAEFWLPLAAQVRNELRGQHTLLVVGRLLPGVGRERAEADVRTIARRLEQLYPEDNAKRSARLEPMHEAAVGRVRRALLVLFGAVGAVLLIVCLNVANLFLARATAREREVAVRTALGARRSRLVAQFLLESLLLALGGGALGLLVAVWGVDALVAAAPENLPRASEIHIDARVLAFVLSVSLLTGLVFGLVPALQVSRTSTLASLKDASRGATPGIARKRFRQGLVVAEVALAVVLVIGAALLVKSFWRLQHVDPGFNAKNLLVAQIQLPTSRYGERPRVRAFYEELRRRIAATPGVRSAAVAFEHPLSAGWTTSFVVDGRQPPPAGQEPEARMRPVMPGYFAAMGIPLQGGRDVTEQDWADAPGVVIVNAAFVRQHFPNEEPVGKRLKRIAWWPEMPTSYEIIGVAADEKFLGLQTGADPATYFAFSHFPMNDMFVIVRTHGDPAAFTPALRQIVWSLDRDLPLDNVRTMDEILAESVAGPRFNASLLALFACVALALAAVGIYGVLSYAVAQRTSEIGIRMALGAQRASVVRLVVGQGVGLAVLGALLGIGAALAVTRLLSSLVFEVSTTDPLVFAGVGLLLTAIALLAAYVPARRASRIDPVTALRYE